ncbi:MAG: NAD(P)H-dependent oxidoreductase [Chlamydiales bacterium]|nr:NAD(P)H-dependent oxidoreductase [Chlamydiales bacterium]
MWKWMIVFCVAFSATLNAEIKVLAFAGSTREDSVNKKLVVEAAKIARQLHAKVEVVDLRDYPIPFYDEDLETSQGMPIKAKQFRQLMINSDVILIASPEYNGSLSAVLKNTIDWASRGENGGGSREAFKGKKFVIMSAAPGPGGGARGLVHLRAIIENIGGTVLPQQVVVPGAYNAFDEQGRLKDEKVRRELEQLIRTAINER